VQVLAIFERPLLIGLVIDQAPLRPVDAGLVVAGPVSAWP
jgi:hypothetical protein